MAEQNEWIGYVDDQGRWTSADGVSTYLSDMSEGYLVNIICLTKRQIDEMSDLPFTGIRGSGDWVDMIVDKKIQSLKEMMSEAAKRWIRDNKSKI